MVFSFLATMRLQAENSVAELFERLVNVGRSHPTFLNKFCLLPSLITQGFYAN